MDELRKMREKYFVGQQLKRQFSSVSSIHNKSRSESIDQEHKGSLEHHTEEKESSVNISPGKIKPKVLMTFNPDAFGDSKDNPTFSNLNGHNTVSFPRRRLDFNPELTKTLTNQLKKPHQTSLLSLKRQGPSQPIQAVKPVKPTLAPNSTPKRRLDDSDGKETSMRLYSSHSQLFVRVNLSDADNPQRESSSSNHGHVFVPHFKSFTSNESRHSASASKQVDVHLDKEEGFAEEPSSMQQEDKPRLAPESAQVFDGKIKAEMCPNDLLLSKCRQMMTELHDIKKETDGLSSKIFKYRVFSFNEELSSNFRKLLVNENQHLSAKLAEIKPQMMIVQKKFETIQSKLERAKLHSLSLFTKKRDLEIKKALNSTYQNRMGDLRSKISEAKSRAESFSNQKEMELTQIIQAKDNKWRGQVLHSIYAMVKDSEEPLDEEDTTLLNSILKLKEKLDSS